MRIEAHHILRNCVGLSCADSGDEIAAGKLFQVNTKMGIFVVGHTTCGVLGMKISRIAELRISDFQNADFIEVRVAKR